MLSSSLNIPSKKRKYSFDDDVKDIQKKCKIEDISVPQLQTINDTVDKLWYSFSTKCNPFDKENNSFFSNINTNNNNNNNDNNNNNNTNNNNNNDDDNDKVDTDNDDEDDDLDYEEEETDEKNKHKVKNDERKKKKINDRKFNVFPNSLTSVETSGILSMENNSEVIRHSLNKLQVVLDGKYEFGKRIVLKDFKCSSMLPYSFPATVQNIMFLHFLFRPEALYTKKGKVSVFPVTVHNDEKEMKYKKNGYPCLLIHAQNFSNLIREKFSAFKHIYTKKTIYKHLGSILCHFDAENDEKLITLTGFDPYQINQKKEGGFVLLPAHWVDVMKHFFIEDEQLIDISQIFRNVYPEYNIFIRNQISKKITNVSKFDDEFKCIFLGDYYRIVAVNNIIKPNGMSHSMSRCRALNKKVQIGRNHGILYLPQEKDAFYDEFSFCYGVECWDKQLEMLNSMLPFFNEQRPIEKPTHMTGLLFLDDENIPVLTRKKSIAHGIHNEIDLFRKHNSSTSHKTRNERNGLRNKYGPDILNSFWTLATLTING